MTSSVASGEHWENYLSSYLRPVASKRPFCQSAYQSNCQSGGIPQFEELRVLPKEAQEANSITSAYLEQNHMTKTMSESGSKEESATNPPRPLGKAVYAVDYTLPVVNSGTFLNDCNVVDPYVDPYGARVGIQHNANYVTLKFGKASLKSTKYLGRGNELNNPQRVAQAPSSTQADMLGSHNTQCDVTDQQELQELVGNNSFVDGSNTESCLYQQFNTITGEQELVGRMKEDNGAKMRTLPNFSTFRVFSKVTKLDMASHDKTSHPVQLENTKNALITDRQEQMALIDCESMTSPKLRKMTVRGVPSNPEMNMQGNNSLKDQRHCTNEFDHFTGKGVIARGSANQRRKTVSCTVCFKSFSQTANLKAHLRIHTGEKPFECPVCHNRFSQRSSVKTHMRIHSGERPFQCSICPKSFYDSSTLIKHRRIHTGEKPYFCKICKHEFSQSGNLTRHYKLHTK